MAEGLSSDFEQSSWVSDCLDCEVEAACCDESCEGRIWVAPCGSINYATGEIENMAAFCEPLNVTAMSHTDNATVREKQYRNCKKARRRGQPDYSFSLSFDICQSEAAHGLLLGRCAFDYVIAPKANNLNFELNGSIFDQETYVMWGRSIGDSYTWEYPDDECQNTSRTYMTDRFCWETQIQALIA